MDGGPPPPPADLPWCTRRQGPEGGRSRADERPEEVNAWRHDRQTAGPSHHCCPRQDGDEGSAAKDWAENLCGGRWVARKNRQGLAAESADGDRGEGGRRLPRLR